MFGDLEVCVPEPLEGEAVVPDEDEDPVDPPDDPEPDPGADDPDPDPDPDPDEGEPADGEPDPAGFEVDGLLGSELPPSPEEDFEPERLSVL